MGLKPGSSTFASSGPGPTPGLFSITRVLPSIYHDREWQRNSVCQDPHKSPGLPCLTFRGEIEGFWRAKFLFYDFDMYRQILAGNIRGVYTGTFAEQATELELKETVVKVRKEDVGGKGPMLCAGFDAEQEGYNPEEEQRRIEAGYGNELVADDAPDEDGWTKEVLVSGTARTSWGVCKVRGRIRAWDGLVIMSIAYTVSRPRILELMLDFHNGTVVVERISTHGRSPNWTMERYLHPGALAWLRRCIRHDSSWRRILSAPVPHSDARFVGIGSRCSTTRPPRSSGFPSADSDHSSVPRVHWASASSGRFVEW